jgi:uncharacterized protein YuzE
LEGESLKLDYDPDEDVLYMHFRDGPAESIREVEDDVIVEFDKDGEVMGVEVWGIRRKGVLRQLAQVAVSP